MRADARRNYDRLVAQARAVFLEQGITAPLEDIARRTGVGIGTLYRHFPSRTALIEAVLQEETSALLALADQLTDADDPLAALTMWLRAISTHSSAFHGIAAALVGSGGEPGADATVTSSKILVREAGEAILERAQRVGAVRGDVDILDLMRLANAIGLAAREVPEDPELGDRLLLLAMNGLRRSSA